MISFYACLVLLLLLCLLQATVATTPAAASLEGASDFDLKTRSTHKRLRDARSFDRHLEEEEEEEEEEEAEDDAEDEEQDEDDFYGDDYVDDTDDDEADWTEREYDDDTFHHYETQAAETAQSMFETSPHEW
eukprot:CAMPEP_0194047778 /NCGR_PEP_ID=MMETSP0009_2-20130614/25492_1 /TAXON_ID=210454 /ORGANISM="Grammatophora oceanica, Strain CCMP 410" /LENGTH=131 /DNA_ID=CAMNT_0038693487 /DNA_START=29 /DNA_END=421 /DNA_ORIENTATION=+